jgi:hypothetical protein
MKVRASVARYPIKPLTLEQWAQLGAPWAIARLAQMQADAEQEG